MLALDGQHSLGGPTPQGSSIGARTPGERVIALQILRFLAASSVILLHATQVSVGERWVGPVSTFGTFGVDLFFVLSGVIMARVAQNTDPVTFLTNRITRIFPIYWILTVIFMVILAISGLFSWKPLLTSFLLLPSGIDCYLSIAWTLRFELMFYLATTLVLMGGRGAVVALVVAYAAASVARFHDPQNPLLNVAGSPLALEFVAGLGVARLRASRWSVGLAGCVAIAWLAGVAVMGLSGASDARAAIYGPPAVMLAYVGYNLKLTGPWAARLAYLGDASYSAYLVHLIPVFLFAPVIRSAVPAVVAIPGLVIVCWIIAVLTHEAAEKPLIQLSRRALRPWLARATGAWPIGRQAHDRQSRRRLYQSEKNS